MGTVVTVPDLAAYYVAQIASLLKDETPPASAPPKPPQELIDAAKGNNTTTGGGVALPDSIGAISDFIANAFGTAITDRQKGINAAAERDALIKAGMPSVKAAAVAAGDQGAVQSLNNVTPEDATNMADWNWPLIIGVAVLSGVGIKFILD